jgi:cyclic beta-1,2-glucan synthetase
MAGDIYGAAPYVGRGGWSWYTGSAAWLHRAAIENILGLKVQQGTLSVSPRVPAHWPSFEITLRLHERVVSLRWQRAGLAAQGSFKVDLVIAPGQVILLAGLPAQATLLVQAEAA